MIVGISLLLLQALPSLAAESKDSSADKSLRSEFFSENTPGNWRPVQCNDLKKNPDGSWSSVYSLKISGSNTVTTGENNGSVSFKGSDIDVYMNKVCKKQI